MKRIFLLLAAIFLSSNTWAIDKSAENLFIKAQALFEQSLFAQAARKRLWELKK